MKIRKTTDYELIARLEKPVQDLHTSLYPTYFQEYDFEAIREKFKAIVSDDRFIFLVIEDAGKDIGYAMVEMKEYPDGVFKKGYKSVYVHQICMEEGNRNKGYGTKIIEEIQAIAKSKGITVIELDYWVGNNVMRDFCKKQGFITYSEFVRKEL